MTALVTLTSRGLTLEPEHPDRGIEPRALAGLLETGTPVPAGATPLAVDPAAVSPADGAVVVNTPRAFLVTTDGFCCATPAGTVVLDVADLTLLWACRSPTPPGAAVAAAATALDGTATPAPSADRLDALLAAGLVLAVGTDAASDRRHEGSTQRTVNRDFDRRKRLVDAATARRAAAPADGRVPVIPVYDPVTPPNLALGLILGVARTYDGGRLNERYRFETDWVVRERGLARRVRHEGPAVLLFSNYVWSHEQNLHVSAAVKAAEPDCVCIHGGPDTPKYEGDVAEYFRVHPHVDVAVRNEGEHAVAEILDRLDGRLAGRNGDLSVLADIPGIVYRDGDTIVRTPDRPRIAELDHLPSPYLDGTFDDFRDLDLEFMIVETNRGCPYGCTFCDWGSATMSRIRQFDLARVFAELEWGARHRVDSIWLADANFGILARDVEIAAKVVELKERYGYPKSFVACWAKNTTKHIEQIIRLFTAADMPFACTLALQSRDPGVLEAVHRKNIKTEAYDRLAIALREAGATVASDIMLGLPGSSLTTFADDLQACIDREIFVTVYLTALLVNSPMNDPHYRHEHRIGSERHEVAPGQFRQIVVSAATFTRDDHATMLRWRRMYRVFENASLLRFVARWVRHRTGMREIDLYTGIEAAVRAAPERFPVTAWILGTMTELTEPGDWAWFYDEIRRYLLEDVVHEVARRDDALRSELDTVLAVQAAFAPRWGQAFPLTLALPHDFARWYLDVRDAVEQGHDWRRTVPVLATYGPGVLEIDDTFDANANLLGSDVLLDYFTAAEFDSPMKRGRVGVTIPA